MTEINFPTPGQAQSQAPSELPAEPFALASWEIPKGREENWRFTPVAKLSALLADSLSGTAPQLGYRGPQDLAPKTEEAPALVGAPRDRAAAVSWVNSGPARVLRIPAGTELSEPLWLQLEAPAAGSQSDAPQAAAQRLVIEVEDEAKATIIFQQQGEVALNQTLEIRLGERAELKFFSLQDLGAESVLLSNHRLSLGREAVCEHSVLSLNGGVIRINTEVALAGEHCDLNMRGLYFTGSGEHHEHRLRVEHQAAQAKSRVEYKGALQGANTHSVWVGDVVIGPEAYGTDSYEANRNLVIGKGPVVDSVPNLEILNGQIEGAGHASATGRFDDEQLFYLQSRGISEKEAKRLVVRAFFAELLGELEVEELREQILAGVETKLAAGGQLS